MDVDSYREPSTKILNDLNETREPTGEISTARGCRWKATRQQVTSDKGRQCDTPEAARESAIKGKPDTSVRETGSDDRVCEKGEA